ncbi:aspartyl-phosphate phosphatase Spo0E family protein [Bacillus benzoevorans]|uniref:Aspartyl-phosphate phosphatase Spo0E family protein n=1 Tax=Bacillus benzoevorans TaxID=1456 RepID=A0A7X0LX74_9BACI|nr:aspartyl-phosphate phosphatase Spo0E family protein [Bacillus benzoevorans]MBB6446232.1 hypothetical protein [Bacillus benzoevorans]
MCGLSLNEILLLKQTLLIQIKLLGETMMDFGMKEGLTHEKTINLSQELDQYIYLYQKLKKRSLEYALE